MSRRLVELEVGSVLAVPLFVTDEPDVTRFRAAAFEGRGAEFAFARVVADLRGAGYLVEVFDVVAPLGSDLTTVTAGARLFPPVVVSGLAVRTRRWRVQGVSDRYDAERDSHLSDVRLVLGPDDDLRLWHGGTGTETPVDATSAAAYERWTIWGAARLEARVVAALAAR